MLVPQDPPLDLKIVGRTLLHAALVGLSAGIIGCLFFVAVEWLQHLALERLAGYQPLRAHGELFGESDAGTFHPLLLLLLPAAGALAGGLLSILAPETRGGGGDATIEAFHRDDGVMRRRVLWVKPLAAAATLGTGGAGGREGPTLQIGGALGSLVGRVLRTTARERRVLMVAGVAAGISAVFRTPLGAALLAIEVLYRDDFEAEALIPAVLASVVAYSVAIAVFGQSTLFGHLEPFPFHARHLPLYVALALVIALGASLFVATLRLVQRSSARVPVPAWARPALGGLALGGLALCMIFLLGPGLQHDGHGIGVLGGGYGAAQVAISGADWLPAAWGAVEVLLALAKILATALTVGSGGCAGDFAPAMAIGGLLGGAFGLAARIVFDDPAIQPGAFALVGMGAFYGGIANAPLATLVLVCEMAGSYDLLVPLMLAEGVAFIALRRVNLYPAQAADARSVHGRGGAPAALIRQRCGDLLRAERAVVSIPVGASMSVMAALVEGAPDQDVFPVVGPEGALVGLISAEALRVVATDPEVVRVALAADVMLPPASVAAESNLRSAAELMVARDLRALPVRDAQGRILGLLDEHDISGAFLASTRVATPDPGR